MNLDSILSNFLTAPVLFFLLGLVAVAVKSDLEIPPAIAKFFSLYLLFDIGIKGGQELYHSGFTPQIGWIVLACILMSILVPIVAFFVLRMRLDAYNAGAIAATYGSVSAVTFATAQTYLTLKGIPAGGYMVAGMALMESPAIVVGLFLIRSHTKEDTIHTESSEGHGMGAVLKEAFFNGSIVLLVGSVLIGYFAGEGGEKDLHVFVKDIFKGFLCLYLLDMGIVAGSRMSALKQSGLFLVLFGLITPLINAALGIGISMLLGLGEGDALLFTILCASTSYIAVPAAMRMAVPQANMSLLLPLALGVTFPFNIVIGIPLYLSIIQMFIK
ncbi:MAG: sodium-dependent bicarbonate transport family permease [Cytophagales bacterium]|nr:sodium-dependent bicarbonate transport family permease [Cytophagales bacterium]